MIMASPINGNVICSLMAAQARKGIVSLILTQELKMGGKLVGSIYMILAHN
jgi:hypothetical protein